jgi:tight adherence protein E
MLFWLMCSAWIEMSYMSYVSSLGDLAISEATQQTKVLNSNLFLAKFQQVLRQQNSLWRYLVDSSQFRASVRYVKTFADLSRVKDACVPRGGSRMTECGNADGAAIAIYRISYSYHPVFYLFLDSDSVFSREMIAIQEYQRAQFQF